MSKKLILQKKIKNKNEIEIEDTKTHILTRSFFYFLFFKESGLNFIFWEGLRNSFFFLMKIFLKLYSICDYKIKIM